MSAPRKKGAMPRMFVTSWKPLPVAREGSWREGWLPRSEKAKETPDASAEQRPLRLERDGLLQCAICGEFRRSVGIHTRVHGITADEYRERFGLNKKRGLVGPDSYERYRVAAVDSDRASVLQVASPDINRNSRKKTGPQALESRLHISIAKQQETCARGHPWSEENTYYWPGAKVGLVRKGPRKCRTCERLRQREAKQAERRPDAT